MKYLLITIIICVCVQVRAQVSVYDCSAINPVVTQQDIDDNDDFYKQCVLFTDSENYTFDQNDDKTVTALKQIHIKEDFHVGQFNGLGKMHLRIDKAIPPFDVAVMNYPDLKQVELFKRLELALELPTDLYTKVRNFVDDLSGDKINPFLEWEMRVYAEFTHPQVANPIIVDGFYMKNYNPVMVNPLPEPANGEGYTEQEYDDLGSYEESITLYNFRVRFAPIRIGNWTCKVHIVTPSQTISSPSFQFHVVDTGNQGYLRAGNNGRFLEIGSGGGTTFLPVGANAPWPSTYEWFDPEFAEKSKLYNWSTNTWGKAPEEYRTNYLVPRVYEKYRSVLSSMADGGANMFRLIMYPNGTDIEWEELGNYSDRLHMGQELDRILEFAENRNLYILWDMQIHYSFQSAVAAYHKRWNWFDNINGHDFCYRTLLGGTDDPVDFFDSNAFNNQEARRYYKQRLRYILARWGYSTNIAAFEVLSEISNIGDESTDNTGDSQSFYATDNNWQLFTDWVTDMGNYINSHHNGKVHLLTSSYSGEITWNDDVYNNPNSPFNCMSSNIYDFAAPSYSEIWIQQVAKRHLNEDGSSDNSYTLRNGNIDQGTRSVKPLLYSETGPEPVNSACRDDVTEMNRAIWQQTFSGIAVGLGWDTWTRTDNFETFGNIAEFVEGIEFDKDLWHPGASKLEDNYNPPAWFYNEDYAKRMVGENGLADLSYLRSGDKNFAIGVITNTSYNVYNTSDCYDLIWDSLSAPNVPQEDRWGSPISQSSPVFITPTGENLKIKGMRIGKNYSIDYFFPNDPTNAIHTSYDVGPKLKLEFPMENTEGTYIILFKARQVQQSWMPQQDSIPQGANNEDVLRIAQSNEVQQIMEQETLTIYPVPSSTKVVLELRVALRSAEIEIYALDGKLMDQFTLIGEREVDIKAYEIGTYLVKCYLQDTILVKKIIKQ